MAEDGDGIEEALEGQLRILLTTAAQIAERVVREREDAQRRAQAHSEQQARELASRLKAEQHAARAELGSVYRAQWWDQATPKQIADTYQVARAWAQDDPEAARAEKQIADEVQTRYGISAADLAVEVDKRPAPAQDAAKSPIFSLAEYRNEAVYDVEISKESALRIIERQPADAERDELRDIKGWFGRDPDVDRAIADKFPGLLSGDQRAALATGEDATSREHREGGDAAGLAEAAALMQLADVEERRAAQLRVAAEQEPDPAERDAQRATAEQHQAQADTAAAAAGPAYDSAQRRNGTARQLEGNGVAAEQVATVMRADVSQAKPATEAVKNGRREAPKARRTATGSSRQAQRTALDR